MPLTTTAYVVATCDGDGCTSQIHIPLVYAAGNRGISFHTTKRHAAEYLDDRNWTVKNPGRLAMDFELRCPKHDGGTVPPWERGDTGSDTTP